MTDFFKPQVSAQEAIDSMTAPSYGPIIWVEGLIGSGKTTLTKRIAKGLKLRPILEPVNSNPYLELFYENPAEYAFAMQIELLHRRYALQKLAAFEATGQGGYRGAVLDRGLPGDRVFAKLHVMAGNIHPLMWNTYQRAYDIMTCSLISPSLMIFLDVEPETALARIKTRGRGAEKNISIEYLQQLRRGYLDLMVEIESGLHSWSRGMQIKRIPWNVDYQDPTPIIDGIRHQFRLGTAEAEEN